LGHIFKSLAIAGSVFVATVSAGHAAVLTYGGYTSHTGSLRASLNDPANFAAYGIDGTADAGTVAFGGATASYLAGIDLFFTGYNAIIDFDASDVGNLVDFVNAGGSLVINNDRSTSFTALDPLLNAFGIDIVEAGTPNPETLNIEDPTGPVAQGPFGTVTSLGLRDASRFSITGADVNAVFSWQNGDIAAATLGPDAGAGRLGKVVVLPDVECFMLYFTAGLCEGDTAIAAQNALAYAISDTVSAPIPVPAGFGLAATAFAGLFAFGRRRRAR